MGSISILLFINIGYIMGCNAIFHCFVLPYYSGENYWCFNCSIDMVFVVSGMYFFFTYLISVALTFIFDNTHQKDIHALDLVQGQQGLSVHFEMALTGRKKVAMS